MEFSEREITDLAAFFAKRFPSFEERASICEATGLAGHVQLAGDASAAWTDAVRAALQRGCLQKLVQRAAAHRSDDENLAEMARVLGAGQRWRPRRWGLVAGVAAVASFGIVATWAPWAGVPVSNADVPNEGRVPAASSAVVVQSTALESPVGSAEGSEPGVSPVEAGVSVAVPDPSHDTSADTVSALSKEAVVAELDLEELAVVPPAVPAISPSPEARVSPKARVHSGAPLRCEGEPGAIIGYWYAGETSPGSVGSHYTVDGGINVRASYPSSDNGYDSRSALVCTLGHSWELRLGHEPVFVTGGAYWVPLSPDDIVAR